MIRVPGFHISSFKSEVSGFMSRFQFRASSFMFCVSGWDSGFRFRVSGFGFLVPGFGIRDSGFGGCTGVSADCRAVDLFHPRWEHTCLQSRSKVQGLGVRHRIEACLQLMV